VFGSGFCALLYQMVWTRQLRLIFGASTAASSAVIAIFIAGLGFGGLWFGSRVERSPNPLRFYARLELAIAGLCALTPLLLQAADALYVASGGSPRLGAVGSNLLRLVLASLLLLPPTWLMGGTLPALARAIELDSDGSRRAVAVAYALNTLGAVLGCALASFVLLEALGNRGCLYLGCGVNAVVGVLAFVLSRHATPLPAPSQAAADIQPPSAAETAHPALVFASAGLVGFAFFLMELVWYRMLGPLLGGSVFTFGLILSIALAGIGVGSALYAALAASRSRLWLVFALSCAAEAACIALPYALGDRLALTALFLQTFWSIGFAGVVLGWTVIALIVVFPAALLSGLQFPLLIALLGAGRSDVGRHVGWVYAANTVGAIAGALAGGFGLLPALGALGCWRAVTALLAGWSVLVAGVTGWRPRPRIVQLLPVLLLSAASFALLGAQGPSAVFRHAPIGVGRVPLKAFDGPSSITSYLMQQRRSVDWEADGIESAVAISHYDGISFTVNGKSDGSALADAPTQVMGGLLGAALVPKVKKALVIGLGTGSTAGWLASLPEIERVDVAEIEPAISHVAERCKAVNRDALHNPKLHLIQGDARELLSVLDEQYDVIFSEPSNPYRAGVASLYAREFYQSVQRRLQPQGLFVQWLQAYDIDAPGVRTIYATLAAEFAHIETWNGLREDLFLVASREPLVHDVSRLRARIAEEPFKTALRLAWYADSVEGFFAHYVANEGLTKALAAGAVQLNTDDISPVEFGFARNARGNLRASFAALRAAAAKRLATRPTLRGGGVNFERVDFEAEAFALVNGSYNSPDHLTASYQNRFAMLSKWLDADFLGAMQLWIISELHNSAETPSALERLARAEMLANEGSIESEREIARLLADRPTESIALRAQYSLLHQRIKQGSEQLVEALQRYRGDPWAHHLPMLRLLSTLQLHAASDAALAVRWLDALDHPFALRVNEGARDRARLRIAQLLGIKHLACVKVLQSFEPYPNWTEELLEFRNACYDEHKEPKRDQAARDLLQWRAETPVTIERLLAL
jgi:spermidine synthase